MLELCVDRVQQFAHRRNQGLHFAFSLGQQMLIGKRAGEAHDARRTRAGACNKARRRVSIARFADAVLLVDRAARLIFTGGPNLA